MSNGSQGGSGEGGATTGDIIDILNSDAVKRFEERIAKALEQKKDSSKREGLKDAIFQQASDLLDVLIDKWMDIKEEKALEGGYEEDVDEIDDVISEIRDKLNEAYAAAGQANTEEQFNAAKSKIEEVVRLLAELKRKIRRLERKQRRARQGSGEKGVEGGSKGVQPPKTPVGGTPGGSSTGGKGR